MAKIDRYNGNVQAFGSTATGVERTVFGDELTQSNTLDANITADYFRGWGILAPGAKPPKQFFNGIHFTQSQLVAYLHQMGVAEWNATQEYHIGSIANVGGVLYSSLVNTNVGNDPVSSTTQWRTVSSLSIDTIADLRVVTGGSGSTATVSGYYSAGDGGGGPLRIWKGGEAPGTYVDNGGSIIVPTGGDGSGSWVWEWSGPVIADWFGAVGDGITDDYDSILSANTAVSDVELASGKTYLTNQTITMGDYERLHLQSGATLIGPVTPVVRVGGLHSTLSGEGWSSIIESTVSPISGVVKIGHDLITDSKTIWRNTIRDFNIQGNDPFGVSGLDTIGLFVFNSQPWNSSGSVYWNSISNIFVNEVKETLVSTSICNANSFDNIQGWKAGVSGFHIYSPFSTDGEGVKYGYDWDTQTVDSPAAENTFTRCSVYDSFSTEPTGSCILIDFRGVFNQFTSFAGEPTWGIAYNVGTLPTKTYIQGQFNAGSGINAVPDNNTILISSGGSFASIAIRDAQIYKQQIMILGTKASPSIFDRFSVTTGLYFPSPGVYARTAVEMLDVPATSGGLGFKAVEAVATITATTTITVTGFTVPAKSRLIAAQFNVDSALAIGDEWNAVLFGGDTTTLVTSGGVSINSKVDTPLDGHPISAGAGLRITRTAGGSFTAQGSIRCVLYYQILTSLDDI